MYKRFFKRPLDIILVMALVPISAPLFILITLFLFIDNKGAVFFCQLRPGKHQVPFMLYKFKTMHPPNEEYSSDTDRITTFGKFLRKFSLDELPQLVNILIGDMSFIGPRPLLMKYLPLYSEEQNKRHLILPGITGWAQIKGRNSISWEDKFELDAYYVNHLSWYLDLKILLFTPVKLFVTNDVYTQDQKIIEDFNGNN